MSHSGIRHEDRRVGRIHTGLRDQYLLRYDLDTSFRCFHGVGFTTLASTNGEGPPVSNWVTRRLEPPAIPALRRTYK